MYDHLYAIGTLCAKNHEPQLQNSDSAERYEALPVKPEALLLPCPFQMADECGSEV